MLILLALAVPALLAQPVPPERLALAKKLVQAMDLATAMEASMAASQEAVGANLTDSLMRSFPGLDSLTPPQRARMSSALTGMTKRLQQRIQEELAKSMNVGEEVASLLAPVYASYFDGDELSKLLEFYETPVGRKLAQAATATQPQVMQKMQAGLLPRMMSVMERVVREEQTRMGAEMTKLAEELVKSK